MCNRARDAVALAAARARAHIAAMASRAAPILFASPAVRAQPRAVATWLFAVAGLVFLMVVVGGITRLTESGLSITRWEPIAGAIPPLDRADWEAAFALYRDSSQYRLANAGMTLAQFQGIFFWEYVHRLLGRVIGLAFAAPLAWFAWRRAIPAGYGARLALLLMLGGMQGAIGWWMVASGLVDRVDVAHERLAVHLLMALTIMAMLIWTALDVVATAATARRPRRWIVPLGVLLVVQIGFGAFVAGLKAGTAFDTWPLMGETLAPPGLGLLAPAWRNLIDNPLTVLFIHRSLAWGVAALALWTAWRLARAGAGWRAWGLGGAVTLQFALGVATVIHGVPIALGVLHQAGAALLVAAVVVAAHWGSRPLASTRSSS